MINYIVKPNESITDVSLNATGTTANWELILKANNFNTWTPQLITGQVLIIPKNVIIQPNNLRNINKYPVCNNLTTRIINLINNIIAIFNNTLNRQFEDGNVYEFEDGNVYTFENI